MSESAISAKSAKQIFANFVKFVKSIFGTTRRSEGSVTEAEYPTNYQRISNLSLTIRPFRVAILAALLVFVAGWNSEVWGYSSTKLVVNANGGGTVAVTTSTSAPAANAYGNSKSASQGPHGFWDTYVEDTYYVWVNHNSGYRCIGVTDGTYNNAGYYIVKVQGNMSKNDPRVKTVTATFVADFYSKAAAHSVPSVGKVWAGVKDGQDSRNWVAPGTTDTYDWTYVATTSAPTYEYHFYKEDPDGYAFDGWYSNSGCTTLKTKAADFWQSTQATTTEVTNLEYWAKFIPITVSSAGSASASFNHPETKTVTLYFPVSDFADAKADFNEPTITANTGWSISSWKLNTSTHKVEVVCSFTANSDVAKGSYTATVTLKAKSNESNTGTVTANVDLTPTLTYENGSVDISVSDEDKTTLDVGTLKTAYKGADNVAGDGTITYALKTANSNASLTSAGIFYAKALGTYTIVATAAKGRYYTKTAEFTVTVGKRTPTIVFDNTDDPQIIYSGDSIGEPAVRMYNGKVIDRKINYVSSDIAIYVGQTADLNNPYLKARDVAADEGTSIPVAITASASADDYYNAPANTTHNYAVRAKRSPIFYLDGDADNTAKTFEIGETAVISYNENTDASLTVGTEDEKSFITYVHDKEARTITVTAVKGSLAGNGVQTITVNQPGNNRYFNRNKVYTFTVKKHQSTMTLTSATSMYVEDTIATPYSGLANTSDAVSFSCTPVGSMKMENGKLIALQSGANKVTFTQAATEYWTGISQEKTITVNKITPTITSDFEVKYPWYSTIEHPFKSENTMTEFMVQSNNDNLAKYFAEEDEIQVYGTSANSVTFTFNQPGNYKYNAVENYQKSFQIFQPNNRLDMNLSQSNWTDYKSSNWDGNIEWQGGGVLCGSKDALSGYATNWKDKYIVLKFVGIPDTLTFDYERTVSIATDIDWYFGQSANGKDWVTLKENDTQVFGGVTSGSEKFGLLPSTRYVKLCYSGNYGGRFKNVKIKQRKEIVPRKDTIDFGIGFNGNDPTARTITVDWYNVNNCEVSIIGTDADRFVLAEGDEHILSLLDNYDKADLHVTYKHDVNTATTHKATLHIVEKNPDNSNGKTADIILIGQTTPAPQEIVWREDLTPMPSQGSFGGAAYSTSGLEVTLTSLTPQYISVGGEDGLTLTPVAAGTAFVRAYQAGNDKWAEVADTLEIEVTNKKVQFINWEDKLSNLKLEEGKKDTIVLTATSTVEGMPIIYELDTASQKFASIVQDTLLVITNKGKGTITAKQVGNEDYVAVQKTKLLVVRNPNEGCKELAGYSYEKTTLWTLDELEIDINGEPDTLTFWAKCDATALWGLWVAEFHDGYYHDIETINRTDKPGITSTDTRFGPYKLQRNTEKVKLYTRTGATMNRYIHDVEVALLRYVELEHNDMDFSQLDKGAKKTQSLYINYSNISGAFDVTLSHPSTQFEVLTPVVGEECGEVKKNVRIDIRCTGKNLGTELDTIVIKNIDQELRVPVSATVMLPTQAITWHPDVTERTINTTDNIVLSATATSELPVTFVSENPEIAEVVYEAGVYSLDIKKYGDVTIKAQQAGNEDWSPATDKPVVFHIERVTPSISVYPTATAVVLPITLSGSTLQGGAASVEGAFQWQNASQSVTRDGNPYAAEFVPDNTNWYNTVSFDVEVEILKTPQTITWNRADSTGARTIDQVVFDATASSNLPVKYASSDLTIATIDSMMVDEQKVYFLHVMKGGTVVITASQAGDETYAAAPSIEKKITFNRVTPTISTEPVPTAMYIHHFLSNSTPENGVAKVESNTINGTFTWQDPTELMDVPGENDRVVVFTPYNQDLYTTQTCMVTVNVQRFAPTVVSTSLNTDPAYYGTALKDLNLIGSWYAVDHTDPARPLIEGTIEWKYPKNQPAVSVTTAEMIFRPTHTEWYDDVQFNVPIHISQTPVIAPTAAASIVYGQILADAQFESTTIDPISGNKILGTIVLDGSVNMTQCCAEGSHNFPMTFTPNDANYTSEAVAGVATLTVTPGVVFNGNISSAWTEVTNWLDNEKPTTTDRVTVAADVEITGVVTIGGLTINEGKTVTVKEGATLTIGDKDSYVRSAYGSIHVQNGGKLICGSGEVKVKDVILDASLNGLLDANDQDSKQPAKSGQITGESALTITGNAYFDLALDPSGQCSPGWYDFTVPFPVDAATGITRFRNATHEEYTIRNGVNYAIMDFSESRHVASAYGWKKFSSVMQPGHCYSITIDSYDYIYRFKKTATGSFNSESSVTLDYSDVESDLRGWNGLGNGTSKHVDLSVEGIDKVQIYNHSTNSYTAAGINEFTYVVGASYFVQAKVSNSVIEYNPGTKNNEYLRAPQRRVADNQNSEFKLMLTREGANVESDRLYVSASEEALDAYEIGHDLAKFGTPTEAKTAQVWANAYDKKLCDVEMPLINNYASCTLGLYTPQAGSYELRIEEMPQDATLYLTYNGTPVWNLTNAPYLFDLEKGTTEGYGLRLYAHEESQIATGVEEAASENGAVRKVLIDEKIYIITPQGAMYDITGKFVK